MKKLIAKIQRAIENFNHQPSDFENAQHWLGKFSLRFTLNEAGGYCDFETDTEVYKLENNTQTDGKWECVSKTEK